MEYNGHFADGTKPDCSSIHYLMPKAWVSMISWEVSGLLLIVNLPVMPLYSCWRDWPCKWVQPELVVPFLQISMGNKIEPPDDWRWWTNMYYRSKWSADIGYYSSTKWWTIYFTNKIDYDYNRYNYAWFICLLHDGQFLRHLTVNALWIMHVLYYSHA